MAKQLGAAARPKTTRAYQHIPGVEPTTEQLQADARIIPAMRANGVPVTPFHGDPPPSPVAHNHLPIKAPSISYHAGPQPEGMGAFGLPLPPKPRERIPPQHRIGVPVINGVPQSTDKYGKPGRDERTQYLPQHPVLRGTYLRKKDVTPWMRGQHQDIDNYLNNGVPLPQRRLSGGAGADAHDRAMITAPDNRPSPMYKQDDPDARMEPPRARQHDQLEGELVIGGDMPGTQRYATGESFIGSDGQNIDVINKNGRIALVGQTNVRRPANVLPKQPDGSPHRSYQLAAQRQQDSTDARALWAQRQYGLSDAIPAVRRAKDNAAIDTEQAQVRQTHRRRMDELDAIEHEAFKKEIDKMPHAQKMEAIKNRRDELEGRKRAIPLAPPPVSQKPPRPLMPSISEARPLR